MSWLVIVGIIILAWWVSGWIGPSTKIIVELPEEVPLAERKGPLFDTEERGGVYVVTNSVEEET